MTKRTAAFLLCLGWLAGSAAPPQCAVAPETGSTQPLATATTATAEPTTPVAVPHFDRWAKQPNLDCYLPAIRAWDVIRHIRAQTDQLPGIEEVPAQPQIILAQRPSGPAGLSKYSIIFQPRSFDPADSVQWRDMALSFHQAFRASLENAGRFAKVEVGEPVVGTVPGMQRMYLTYGVETQSSQTIRGAYLAAPVRDGILFFNLALEGHGPDALDPAMRELRLVVTQGLAKRTQSAWLYVIAFVLAIPFVVLIFILYKKRRKAFASQKQESRTDRRRRRRR